MQQSTTKQLYAYWDRVRNGRLAPRRFEIEPASIAPLLPETFIAECTGFFSYRFRLVGTHVCDHFGRELRGTDFLSLWDAQDRDAMATAVTTVVRDGAAAHGTFHAYTATDRQATFEFVILPLVHAADSVNRLLGSIAAIDPPFWLGTEPLRRTRTGDGRPALAGRRAGLCRRGRDLVRCRRRSRPAGALPRL